MVTAFVPSRGGSLGAVQVSMLQALTARGIEPDLLVGTSAGALNAAYVAGHGLSAASLDDLEAIWSRLRRRDVFPLQPDTGRSTREACASPTPSDSCRCTATPSR